MAFMDDRELLAADPWITVTPDKFPVAQLRNLGQLVAGCDDLFFFQLLAVLSVFGAHIHRPFTSDVRAISQHIGPHHSFIPLYEIHQTSLRLTELLYISLPRQVRLYIYPNIIQALSAPAAILQDNHLATG
jgi:hypothetical protein